MARLMTIFLGCDHTTNHNTAVEMSGGWRAAPCHWCSEALGYEVMVEVTGKPDLGSARVIEDVHEHYNHSLGMVVRSRRHLKSIQREFGFTDYQPSQDTRERLKYGLEKQQHGR